MDKLKEMKTRALEIVNKPMTYQQIEAIVGKSEYFELARALCALVLAGKLYQSVPIKFRSEMPVYSNKPVPKGFKHPQRDTTLPTLEDL